MRVLRFCIGTLAAAALIAGAVGSATADTNIQPNGEPTLFGVIQSGYQKGANPAKAALDPGATYFGQFAGLLKVTDPAKAKAEVGFAGDVSKSYFGYYQPLGAGSVGALTLTGLAKATDHTAKVIGLSVGQSFGIFYNNKNISNGGVDDGVTATEGDADKFWYTESYHNQDFGLGTIASRMYAANVAGGFSDGFNHYGTGVDGGPADGKDTGVHMVAYIGSDPDTVWVAFEDRRGPKEADYDFNDLVVKFTGVQIIPEPAMVQLASLMGLGFLGMLRLRKRNRVEKEL